MTNQNVAKVEIEVPMELLWNVVESGLCGGINHWCRKVTPIKVGNKDADNLGDVSKEWRIEDTYADGTEYTLGELEMKEALCLISVKYPHLLSEILSRNYDAATGDAFIQLGIFGDVVYG